jgi:uncharacterized protein with GYD domain
MATYIVLMNFTEQGIRKVKDSQNGRTPSKTWRKNAERP